MIGDKSLFSSLDASIKTKIKLGDNYIVDVRGKGTVSILSKQNEVKNIPNLYHVNGLKHNLISVGQLTEKGCEVIFKGSTCTILEKIPSKHLIAHITMEKNILFPI